MVLQSETFPGGYQQQSYSQDGYYSTGYGHGPNMHFGPIPSLISPQSPNMHLEPIPSLISPHMTPSSGYGPHHHYEPELEPKWHRASTDYYNHGSNGHMSSPFLGGSSFSHGMPTGGFGSSFHGATHGPMGSRVKSTNHDYSSYGNGCPSMFHNPTHGGHQSAEWKLKSIEDDD